jgi:hypothetical protein
VQTIHDLSSFGVSTLVVGFGPDLATGEGAATLNAMSDAAADSLHCATDDDCFAAYSCVVGKCQGPGISAPTPAALSRVTDILRARLTLSARCRWTLSTEVVAAWRLSATIASDDDPVAAGDIFLESDGHHVRLLGDTCQKLVNDPGVFPRFSVAR